MSDESRFKVREGVDISDAKMNFSELVARAAAGEEFVITKSGRPTALLSPLRAVQPLRQSGKGKGKWHLEKSFDTRLPNHVLDSFREARILPDTHVVIW